MFPVSAAARQTDPVRHGKTGAVVKVVGLQPEGSVVVRAAFT